MPRELSPAELRRLIRYLLLHVDSDPDGETIESLCSRPWPASKRKDLIKSSKRWQKQTGREV